MTTGNSSFALCTHENLYIISGTREISLKGYKDCQKNSSVAGTSSIDYSTWFCLFLYPKDLANRQLLFLFLNFY